MRRYRITTPEQVSFHYVIAGVVARCTAWFVDQLLIWAGYLAVLFTFSRLGGAAGVALIVLGVFLLDFSYFVLFELYWAGQSPGKRLFKIRVIAARGNKLTFADVLVRNLMRPVDTLPFAMVLGGTVAVADKWHRRLGDFAAETIVVRDARQSLPAALAGEKGRVNSFAADPVLRNRILTRVSREERDLILDLVMRRDELQPAVREELFGNAASHFRARFALPPDASHLSEEQSVVNLALLLQDAKFTV